MDPATATAAASGLDLNVMLENGMVALLFIIVIVPTIWFLVSRATKGQAETTQQIVSALIAKVTANGNNALDIDDIKACGSACTETVKSEGSLTRAALRNDEIAAALNRQSDVQERQTEVISQLKAEIVALPGRSAVIIGGALRDRKYALRLASTAEYSSDPGEAEEARKALDRLARRESAAKERRHRMARFAGNPTPLDVNGDDEFSDIDRILDRDSGE